MDGDDAAQEATVSEGTSTSSSESANQNDDKSDSGRPAGYAPVDLSDLPPEKQREIDDRIRYLYRQVKENGRTLGEYREIARQQSAQIDDLVNGVVKVVDHIENTSNAQTIDQARKEMRDALNSGDQEGYLAAQERLLDLKAAEKVKGLTKQKEKERPSVKEQRFGSASQMGNDAVAEGDITPQDFRVISAWEEESDDSGAPLRPWARTQDPYDPDPDFVKAQLVAKRVWTKHPDRSVQENLAEVDRIMGTSQKQHSQAVLGGRLTTPSKTTKITMTPKQQEIAIKTKFGGPKARSDADHIEAYRKQIEKVQLSRKGR